MKSGEIYGTMSIDPHNIIEAVIMKYIETDKVMVCPIAKTPNANTYKIDADGRKRYFDTSHIYILKESDLSGYSGKINDKDLKELSETCTERIFE